MSDKDNPLEPFKRATTATIRALAGNDELEVTFGQGPPVGRGNRIRVPLPSVGASSEEIDAVRGMGDEYALKMRYHDAAEHQRRTPQGGGPAQEMFQWIEDARIASIGSMRMEGVAQNLDASLEVTDSTQSAIDMPSTVAVVRRRCVAVGLLVRTACTGRRRRRRRKTRRALARATVGRTCR
ncbi:MAG: hypothetical protein U5Q16_14025 [Gammaproteobacteria bacterium]|nr:hypothetical protein [Gammaproteobacteria bacterium]